MTRLISIPLAKEYRLYLFATATLILIGGVFLNNSYISNAQDITYCGDGGYQQSGGSCFDPGGGRPQYAEVVLTANPSTIQQGNSSLLSWGADGSGGNYPYQECTIDNGIGAVAPMGSITVSPNATTNYSIHCKWTYILTVACGNTNCPEDFGRSSDSGTTVTVTQNPTVVASCSVNPTSITTGGSATWTASASGGTGSYTYAWTGTDGLSGSTASVTKTYPTPGTKTGSVTVTSGGQTVTQSCGSGGGGGLIVTDPTSPDLAAGSISPSSATTLTPVTLTSTVSNIGTASTGAGFSALFQRAQDAQGTGATDIGSFGLNTFAPGDTFAARISYTFASPGTYYLRACADKASAGDAGSIPESDETNNCGAWTAVVVGAAALPTLSCSVTPSSVTVPGSATYSASGASAPYTWTPSDGVGSYGTGATASRNFTTADSYGMTVSKAGYTSGNCQVVTATDSGTPTSCTGTTATITANPTRVQVGQTTTLSYTAYNVNDSCTITGPTGVLGTTNAVGCKIPAPTPIVTPPLTTQSTYTITCDGISYPSAIVNVVPKFQEF